MHARYGMIDCAASAAPDKPLTKISDQTTHTYIYALHGFCMYLTRNQSALAGKPVASSFFSTWHLLLATCTVVVCRFPLCVCTAKLLFEDDKPREVWVLPQWLNSRCIRFIGAWANCLMLTASVQRDLKSSCKFCYPKCERLGNSNQAEADSRRKYEASIYAICIASGFLRVQLRISYSPVLYHAIMFAM